MKTLKIEWRHLDVEGETCDRCYDTGENLAQEVKRLKRALQPKGIEIELTETKLDDSQIPQSNTILFNGVPIEDILSIQVAKNYCDSCTTLLGTDTYCRTVTFEGNEYEEIPAKAIRQAAYKSVGLDEAPAKEEMSGCGCGAGSSCCEEEPASVEIKASAGCCDAGSSCCGSKPVPVEFAASTGCGCEAGSSCCGSKPIPVENEASTPEKVLVIDYLYLDLSVCTRCQGTEDSLEDAVADLSRVLEAAGARVVVNKTQVVSAAQAEALGFISSPTIRVNGRDIQLDVRESLCESCGDLCGDEVDCRVWVYRGQEYTVPPKAMIIDAVLQAVYGGETDLAPVKPGPLPENLKRFFAIMEDRQGCNCGSEGNSCCSGSQNKCC